MRAGSEQEAPRSSAPQSSAPQPAAGLPRPPLWLARLFGRDRRRAARFDNIVAMIRIDGQNLKVADVARSGLKVVGYRGPLAPQDRFAFTLFLSDGPAQLELAAEAIVAWRTGDRLGAAFYAMPALERDRLGAFLDGCSVTAD